ncbi:hypothetical protein CTAYLR_006551 [Chrysophaeum taylorii]|uniref:Ankyrin repeat protein n=1 Tax=Chrysophaeum taylorii TaxID=2483200 RepID=A0AAD7UG69_9STRA|nr:hypothetical protein CTAYLR_006551 [Chrysophaeum taylorii]
MNDDTKRRVLLILIELRAVAILNGVDDEDLTLDEKVAVLSKMVDRREEWLLGLLEGVSDDALDALARKRVEDQGCLVEISKLFDKVGVENHVRELLKVMVPGGAFEPKVDENVELPNGVRPSSTENSDKELVTFVELGAINWIDWLLERYGHLRSRACDVAGRVGSLEVLKWARASGYPWHAWTCSAAARGGHLEVLKWARTNGCPWDADTCSHAAIGGHLDVLEWARANSCPWADDVCFRAAENGHLDILKWARSHGCPWNEACSWAALNGHLEVLQWARANGVRAWVLAQPD